MQTKGATMPNKPSRDPTADVCECDLRTQDAIGPHDDDPPTRGSVDSGGTPDTAPLDFDDDEIYSGRGKVRSGGTTQAQGGDSGPLGPPAEQLSPTNSPSDPALRRGRS
jgi:hypothetical protein